MNPILMASAGKYWGLPRKGLKMVIDPYKDCYGRNILPVGSEDFSTNWSANDGAIRTITQNQVVAEWGTNNAVRITATAGNATTTVKSYVYGTNNISKTLVQIKIKNMGINTFIVGSYISVANISVAPGEQKTIIMQNNGNNTIGSQIRLQSDVATNGFDIIAFQPQINLGQLYPLCLA